MRHFNTAKSSYFDWVEQNADWVRSKLNPSPYVDAAYDSLKASVEKAKDMADPDTAVDSVQQAWAKFSSIGPGEQCCAAFDVSHSFFCCTVLPRFRSLESSRHCRKSKKTQHEQRMFLHLGWLERRNQPRAAHELSSLTFSRAPVTICTHITPACHGMAPKGGKQGSARRLLLTRSEGRSLAPNQRWYWNPAPHLRRFLACVRTSRQGSHPPAQLKLLCCADARPALCSPRSCVHPPSRHSRHED